MKKREDHSTRAFTVGVKANRRQVRQAVQKLYGTDAAMVTPSSGLMERRRHGYGHPLIRPDGETEARSTGS